MFRFLLGVGLGFALARLLRPEYVDPKKVEQGFAEIQKRAEALLVESRHILEETRHELTSAMESSRTSVQDKAGRLVTAVSEPEVVIGHHREGEMPRPSQVE